MNYPQTYGGRDFTRPPLSWWGPTQRGGHLALILAAYSLFKVEVEKFVNISLGRSSLLEDLSRQTHLITLPQSSYIESPKAMKFHACSCHFLT